MGVYLQGSEYEYIEAEANHFAAYIVALLRSEGAATMSENYFNRSTKNGIALSNFTP